MQRKFFSILVVVTAFATQGRTQARGNLFIIGGGDRSRELMQEMIRTAGLGKNDYIAILPMSSEEPDSSFFYIKADIQPVCANPLAYLNFTKATANDPKMLDSLVHAKLIFITGGDQTRFMGVVLHTPIYDAIHKAYENGSTVAGTSAGAAVMSRRMITGNQLKDTSYHATFSRLRSDNIELRKDWD